MLLSGVPVVVPVASLSASYTGAAQTVAVVPGLTVSSATQVQSATVAISSGYQKGQDELTIAGKTGSSGSLGDGLSWQFNSDTGALVLSGAGSAATYQNDLAEVVYENTNVDAGTAATNGTRGITAEAVNVAGTLAEATGSVAVQVAAPTVSGTGSGVNFDGSSASVDVGSGITVGSASSLSSASVAISSGYQQGEDVLTIAGQTGSSGTLVDGLDWAFNSTTGTLTLSGAGSAATYQADLQQVNFKDSLYLANAPPTNGIRNLSVSATNAGGTGTSSVSSLAVDVQYLQYTNGQTTTVVATDPSSAVIIGGSSADATGSNVVLDPSQVAGLGSSGTNVAIGVNQYANVLDVGDGSSATVVLPGTTTTLTGDKVFFNSPTSVGNLVIDGSGHTTTINTTLSGTSELINDSVVVDGSQSVTATAGSVVFQNSGTVDAGTNPASLTLNATQAVYVAGAVGAQAELQNLTINAGTTVTFGSSVAITGNLIVAAGTTVTFTGQVTVGGSITVSTGAGASINFSGGVVVTGGLTVTAGGSVTFTGGNVAVGGNVAIGSSLAYSNITSVNFSPTSRLDFSGTAGIYAGSGGLTFGAAVGLNNSYTPQGLTMGTTGPIQFSSGAQVLLGSSPLTIAQAANVAFTNGFTAGGVALEGISGALTVSASATTSSMDVNAQNSSTFAGINIGAGGAVITSNQITFSGGADSVKATNGATTLILRPYNTAEAILVGSPGVGATGKLNISDNDLAAINTGFSLVTIGNTSTGSGAVYVGGISEVLGPIQNSTEIAGGPITVTAAVQIEPTAGYLQLLTTTGDITVNPATGINTTTGDQNTWILMQSAGNIFIDSPVLATSVISLVAGYNTGAGSVTVSDTGANTGILTTLNGASLGGLKGESDNRIEIIAGATSGAITITAASAATNEITAGGSGSTVALSATGGTITQTGILSATNLAVTASGNVALNTNVSAVANESINGFVLTGGSGAAATATVVAGAVTGVPVNTTGSGYSAVPTITLLGGGSSGATATAVLNGTVTAVTVTNTGSGFTTAPLVTISAPGAGTTATATANITGGVSWIAVTNGGSGYASAPGVSFTGGSGSGAAASSTIINGAVVGITVTAAGSGYTSAPTVVIAAPGAGLTATATAVLNAIVTSITITNPGSGYQAVPTVTIAAPGTGGTSATGTAVMTGGVASITLNNAGTGYIAAPTVVFGSGSAGTTINGIVMVGSGSVTITQAVGITVNNVSTEGSVTTPGSLTLTIAAASAGGIAIGNINLIGGAVNLTADAGITNNTGAGTDNIVTSGELTASAKTGIGTSAVALGTSIGTLQATNATSGGIFIAETDGLNIAGTGVQTQAGNGIVVVNVANGSLTVNAAVTANGSGNILLEAAGSSAVNSDLLVTAAVSTGSGDISLIGYRSVDLAGSSSVSTPATGTVDVWGETGSIVEDAAFSVVTGGQNIAFLAGTNIVLGVIDARVSTDRSPVGLANQASWGSVSVVATAGSITDSQARTVTTTEIYASTLGLKAGTGIGNLGSGTDNPVETEAITLGAATTTSGGIDLQDATGVTIGTVASIPVNRVAAAGSTSATTTATVTGLGTSANGSVILRTVLGTVILNQNVEAAGAGNILIQAVGTGFSILDNAFLVQSVSGNVTMIAPLNITVATGDNIESDGNVDLEATSGTLTLTATNEVSTGNAGNIRIIAGVSVTMTTSFVTAGLQDIAITAGSGSITGTGFAGAELLQSSLLWLNAGTGIGSSGTPLLSDISTVTAAAGSGGIYVQVTSDPPGSPQAVSVNAITFTLPVVNDDATTTTATVASQSNLATTSNGNIQLTTVQGSITLVATNGLVTANGTGTVTLNAGGSASNLTTNAIVSSGTGAIALTAGNGVTQNANVTTGGVGTVGVTATAGSITTALAATTTSASGSITYSATTAGQNITLNGTITSTSGIVSVTAGNNVNQNGNITTGSTATIGVTATAGAITMGTAPATTTSGSGAITYQAGTNVLLGVIQSTSGPINVTAGSGAITNNLTPATTTNLSTSGLATLSAAIGIGTTATNIYTAIGSLTASNSGSGIIDINQTGAMTIVSGGVVNSGSNGDIIIVVGGGTLTVNGVVTAAGSGLILLNVTGPGGGSPPAYNITTSATVSSGTGSISILVAASSSGSVTLGGSVTTIGAGSTGTIDIESGAGSITINDNKVVQTAGGNILLKANGSVQVSGVNASTGSVTITATTGSITDDSASINDVTAASARFSAAIGIGTSALPIEVDIATVAAAATSGGIFIKDSEGVTVGTVAAVSVNQVLASDTTTSVGDGASTSDLATTSGGNISLVTTAGSITLTDGFIANNLAIDSDTGSITVNAATDVLQQTNLSTGGSGTISVTATSGTITMTAGTTTTSAIGAITYTAGVNIVLSIITSTSGPLNLTATTGTITNTLEPLTTVNLATSGLATLTAGTGIGAASPFNINTTVGSLTASTTSTSAGTGIFIIQTAAMTIASPGLSTAGGNGPISIVVNDGILTDSGAVSANGSGNILLDVVGTSTAASDLLITAAVGSGSGNISLLGYRNVAFSLVGNVTVGAVGGTIQAVAQNGTITQGAANFVQTDGANIILNAATGITVGIVDARVNSDRNASPATLTLQSSWGDVSLYTAAGTIINAQTRVATGTNIFASALRLESSTGIGILGGASTNNPIITEVATVAAVTDSAASGDINLLEDTAVTVGTIPVFSVSQVSESGAVSNSSTTPLSGLATTSGSIGSIVLVTTNGTITIANSVNEVGTGNVLIQAQGAGSSVLDQVPVQGASGNVSIIAANNVTFTATGNVTVASTPGTIEVIAQAGAISQTAANYAQTDGENIIFNAATGITLGIVDARVTSDQGGTLTSQLSWGNVSLFTTSGTIVNAQTRVATGTDIYANNLRLESATGIGILGGSSTNNPIITEVITVAAVTDSAASGDINLLEDTAITVGTVAVFSVTQVGANGSTSLATTSALAGVSTMSGSTGGIVLVTTSGTITVANAVNAGGSGNILVNAQGSGSNVTSQALVKTITGNVTITAANNVTFQAGGNVESIGGSPVVTASASTLVGTISGVADQIGIAVDPVTNMLYVDNVSGAPVNTVTVIDGATNTVVTTINVGYWASGVAVNPVTNTIYVTNEFGDSVSVINGATNTVTNTINLGAGANPLGVAVDSTHNLVYVADNGGGTVSVIDGSTNAVVSTLTVGASPHSIAVDPITNKIYVSNDGDNTVSVITGTSNGVGESVSAPISLAPGTSPAGIGVDTTTNTIYVANVGSNTVSVIDGGSNTVLTTLAAGTSPYSVTVDSSTNTVYVTNVNSNNLTEINAANNTVFATVAVGSNPYGITVNPTTGRIYVANSGDSAVGVLAEHTTLANVPGGTVQITALAGNLTQDPSVTVQAEGANVVLQAQGSIVLGTVDTRVTSDQGGTLTSQSSWGNVALTATTGTITNARARVASLTNIFANGLRLESSTGIGILGGASTNNPIITEVATVAAQTDSAAIGDINLLEQTAVTVGTVGSFTVTQVGADGSTSLATTSALAGVATTTGSIGGIVLQTNVGTVTVSNAVTAGGSGNVLLQAQGSGSSVLDSAAVQSATGNISIIAANSVTFSAGGNVTVTGAGGTIQVTASAGAITQTATNDARSDGSNIIFTAATGITVGIVDARLNSDRGGTLTSQSSWGNVSLKTTTGTIINAQTRVASSTNIFANNLRLESATGIGILGGSTTNNPIVTEVITVAAATDSAASGDINLLEDTAITVGTVAVFSVTQVAADGSTSLATTSALAGVATATGSTGGIVLVATSGQVNVNNTVSAGGTGNILIQAGGAASDLDVTAAITDATGNITLTGGNNVNFTVAGNVTVLGTAATGGSIQVTAQSAQISQGAGNYAQTDEGNIIFTAATSIVLGIVDARLNADRTASPAVLTNQSAWGNIALTATTGTITNAQARVASLTNIYANGLRLESTSGIGILGGSSTNNPILTEVATVAAVTDSTVNGDINLLEDTAITVGTVGVFSVTQANADGSTTTISTTSLSGLATTAGSIGAIVLETTAGTITVSNAVTAGASGNILLQAQGAGASVLDAAAVQTATGSISIIAANSVTFSANGNVTVTGVGGTILAVAQAGSISQLATNTAQTDGSNIIFNAATGIIVGVVDARLNNDRGGTLTSQSSWGNVSLMTTTGTIINAQARVASSTNIFANNLRLESSTGIGILGGSATNNPIVTEVITAAAATDSAASGDINLLENTAITVGTVAVFSVTQANADGSTATVSTTSLAGISTTTGSTGGIVLATTNGQVDVNNAVSAGGTGNILIQSGGAASDLNDTAAITDATGNISLIGGNNVNFTASGNVTVLGTAATGGTVQVTAQVGAISQTSSNSLQTDAGNIIFTAASNIVLGTVDARLNADRTGPVLTNQSAWGNVALTASGTNITNAQARVASTTNIFADNLRLQSVNGVGILGAGVNNPIVTEAATVAAATNSSSLGAINILEQTAITVGTVAPFSVNQVAADGSTSTASSTTASLAGLTTGVSGRTSLVTNNGTITVVNQISDAGNILVQAQGAGSSVLAQAPIQSAASGGNITIIGATDVTFTGTGTVTAAGTTATIGVIAQAGSISQLPALAIQSDGSNIILTAAVNIVLGVVDARLNSDRTPTPGLTSQSSWGNVALTATGGTITNAQAVPASATNIFANNLRLESSTGIGLLGSGTANPIVTEVAAVAAVTDSAASGDINLLEDTAVTVGTIAVFSVNQVGPDGSTSLATTSALAGVATTTGSTGSIVLVTLNGTITVANGINAGGSGNILIQSQGTGSNVLGQAGIETITGNITVIAAGNATFTVGNVTVTGGGAANGAGGTIEVLAQTGSISQGAANIAQTDGGNIVFTAAINVTAGIIDARVASDQGGTIASQSSWGNVALTATGGTITNAAARVASTTTIYANNLRLESSTGIGILGSGTNNPIVTEVATTAARTDSAVSGDINLLEQTAITVGSVAAFTVNQVAADASTSLATTSALAGLASATGSTGDIILEGGAAGGTSLLTVSSPVSAGGSGNILLYANGTGSNLAAGAAITTGSGDISVVASNNLILFGTANVIVSGGAGTIVLEAQNGSITQGATLTAQTNGGNIGVAAGTSVVLGIVDAEVNSDRSGGTLTNQSGWGNVTVLAFGGAITSAQPRPATLTNVYANGAVFSATAGIGVLGSGVNNPIITEVATIAGGTTTSGDINILEQTAITVGTVPTFSVNLVGIDNTLTTNQTTQATTSYLTATGSGNVVLVTNNGSITLVSSASPATTAVSAAGSGNVLIEAQGSTSDLTLNAAVVASTGAVTLSAGRNVLMGSAVTESETGNLAVEAGGNITMAANNAFSSPSGVLLSAGGAIALGAVSSTTNVWLTAGGAITNADGTATVTNVTAANAVIDAGNGAGIAGRPLQAAVGTLTATGGTGGIYVNQSGALVIGPEAFSIVTVNADSTTSTLNLVQNSVVTAASGGGAIVLAITGGGLTVNGHLSSPAGVSISSAGAVQENYAVVDTGGFTVTASTSITMAAAASITATSLSVASAGDIQVSTVNTGTGPISITGGGALINVLGSSGGTNLTGGAATITTANSQGTTADTLNTALGSLNSTVTGTGTIVLAQTGALTLTNATTASGLIQVIDSGALTAVNVLGGGSAGVTLTTTSGDLVATSVTSASGSVALTAAGNLTAQSVTASSGGATLTASGGNLLVGSVTAGNLVTATASAQISQQVSGAAANITAPQVTLTAGTGIGASSAIVVATPLLAASSTSGNIQIRNLLATTVTVTNLSTGTGSISYSQAGGAENVTNATTTNGNISLSLDSGALNVQNVAAGGTGNVNLNVTGNGSIQYTTATAGGGVLNLGTAQTVTLTKNIVTNGVAVNLSGNILLTMNTSVVTNGGAVNFVNTVAGPYALTISAGAGAVNFTQAVGAGSGNALTLLAVATNSTLSFGGAVTVAGNINVSSAGLTFSGGANSVSTTSGGQFVMQAAGSANTIGVGVVPVGNGYTSTLTPTDITALAPGFSQILIGSITNTARVDIGNASFTSPTMIESSVAVQVLTGQTLSIGGANPLTLLGGAGDSGLVALQAGSSIASGTGTVTITADEVNVASSAGSITGTGTLVLEPLTLSRPIVVGQAGVSGQFALNLAALAAPATTLAVVKIGNTLGTGPINVSAVNLDFPVLFQAGAPTGSLNFTGNVSTTLANDSLTANVGGTITVAGNLTVAVSGSITLTADVDGNGVGDIVIAPTANEMLHTVSGNINLTGQNLTFGTFTLWTELLSSGSVTMTVGAVGGTLQINDIYSEIKAGTTIAITSGSTTPSVTGQLEIEGQVQAVGTITVTSNSSINLDNATVVALGNIALQANAGIQLSAGIVNSQNGTVTVTANSNKTGAGTLSLGGISPILITSPGAVTLTGENVAIGNSVAFARVLTSGNVNIFADYYAAGNGTVTMTNAGTLVQTNGSGAVQFGSSSFAAGTPYAVNFTGGTITSASTLSLYALNAVNVSATAITTATTLAMSSNVNMTMGPGNTFTATGALTLMADASTGQSGALVLAANPTTTLPSIYDPNGTVTLEGYTVTNNAVITTLKLVITTGH